MTKCSKLGCMNKSVAKGRCNSHQPATLQSSINNSKASRPEYTRLYQTSAWKNMRKQKLYEHPLCMRCDSYGVTTPAVDVDHVVPHKGDANLFYNTNNLQTLCHRCHSYKTREEQQGRVHDFRQITNG